MKAHGSDLLDYQRMHWRLLELLARNAFYCPEAQHLVSSLEVGSGSYTDYGLCPLSHGIHRVVILVGFDIGVEEDLKVFLEID